MKLRHFWLWVVVGLALLIFPGAGAAAPNRSPVAAGYLHTLFIQKDGTLWAWGYNAYGQLGRGNTTDQHSPVQVKQYPGDDHRDHNWVAVAAGQYHSLGLKADGTLWAWGYNGYGQLGNGNYNQQTTPQPVGSATNWVAVAAGGNHSLGVQTGTVPLLYAWGNNNVGQLGLGNNAASYYNTPQAVGSPTMGGAAAGYAHSLGLGAGQLGGEIFSCGWNIYGQLGNSSLTNSSSFGNVFVGSGVNENWVAAAAGYDFSLGIQNDGTLWAWGENTYGQLGLGNTTYQTTAQQVGSNHNWVAVASSEIAYHSLGLKNDLSLWAWGYNAYGQLGVNYPTNQTSPVSVGTGYVAVAAGWGHSVGLKADGTLWAWGYNAYGQLGLGNTTDQHTPTKVPTKILPPITVVVPSF